MVGALDRGRPGRLPGRQGSGQRGADAAHLGQEPRAAVRQAQRDLGSGHQGHREARELPSQARQGLRSGGRDIHLLLRPRSGPRRDHPGDHRTILARPGPLPATRRSGPYRNLATFREQVEAALAADDPSVLDPVTSTVGSTSRRSGKSSPGPEWSTATSSSPFDGLRAERPRKSDPRKERRDFTFGEVQALFAQPLFVSARGQRTSPCTDRAV